jgi:hypothetical protein
MPIQPHSPKIHPSWRDILPIHPAAELFPLMAPDELKALGEDIKKNGLTSPIVLWRGDPKAQAQLLDGRNRLDAIELMTGCPVEIGPPSLMAGKDFLATCKVSVFEGNRINPYAYVISANIHRRHLTAEQKRELIAKLIKAQPEKSDRQIAEAVKADHKTVGAVRAEQEARGEIPHVETRTDSRGRKQPATKPVARARGPTHVCWQCRRRGAIGEVQQHHYAQYDDVWLHDACVSAFDQAEQWREQEREAAAERIHALMGGKTEPRDDIGPASTAELARLRARIEELQADKRRLEIENVGLRSEIEELKARLATVPPADDGLDIPPSLRRAAP